MHQTENTGSRAESQPQVGLQRTQPRQWPWASQPRPCHVRFAGSGTERYSSFSAKCAPKCAPNMHGAVRAAGYHWHALGITMALAYEKTRIYSGKR